MKKKIIKKVKENKQIVEIHIYIHQNNVPQYPSVPYNPNGTYLNPLNPPYIVTC
jgi:hypothetical protein